MTAFVAGASGATGRLLVKQLLDHKVVVKAVIREQSSLPEEIRNHPNLTVIRASLLDIPAGELAGHVKGCDAVFSCLGHNLSLKGIYGKPRKLVYEAVERLSGAVEQNHPPKPVRMILMNTAGNRNRDLPEPRSFMEKLAVGLIRFLVPPHRDNEEAAEYLRSAVGQEHRDIEWAAVRPDNLIDAENPTDYRVYPSPIRSAIFNPGVTSRINVAHFMARLITEETLWSEWKGQMPVIYNVHELDE